MTSGPIEESTYPLTSSTLLCMPVRKGPVARSEKIRLDPVLLKPPPLTSVKSWGGAACSEQNWNVAEPECNPKHDLSGTAMTDCRETARGWTWGSVWGGSPMLCMERLESF